MIRSVVAPSRRLAPTVFAVTVLLAGCGGGDGPARLPTLDGNQPLILSHRGLPGLYPEETRLSYEAAADAGGDSLELDVHLTRDCVLVARHNPWLSDNTNIADVAAKYPEVMARKRTVPGVLVPVKYDVAKYGGPAAYLSDLTNPADPKSVLKSLVVDGEDHTGDWSITDFTLAELRQYGINGTTYDARNERPTNYNGLLPILTFQEVIDIAKAKSKTTGRSISVYPETKNPVWNNAQAKANGCGAPGASHPFEDAYLKVINDNGLNSKDSALFVQSFDPDSLQYLRSAGLKAKAVQLIDGNDVDYKTGNMIYVGDSSDVYTFVDGRPYSYTVAGNPTTFGDMLAPAGLAQIQKYADGIGPWKPQVMRLSGPTGKLADVNSAVPTSVVGDAHKAGLFVHVYTFRNEKKYLAGLFNGDPVAEYLPYFRAGVDGVFTDFTGTGVQARQQYLKETGR
ncbi:MAG: glycerophosphodiester phosphodiesterase [Proteobacteria bacterium]|nr:glycerophosphodiester phosphodiesterase [Pseudomonadota bacterium]